MKHRLIKYTIERENINVEPLQNYLIPVSSWHELILQWHHQLELYSSFYKVFETLLRLPLHLHQ